MKVRVLQVCGQLTTGGQEMMAKQFYQYIDKTVFDFDYLVYGDEIGNYEDELKMLGARIIHVDSIFSRKNLIKNFRNIYKIIKEGNYHAVHSHTYTSNGVILKLAKMAGVPIRVSHCHSTSSGKKSSLFHKVYKKLMISLIRNNGTHFIACGSDAGNSFYGKEFFEANGLVIKNGIDLDKFSYSETKAREMREEIGIAQHEIVIGHIGRFAKVKNHKYILEIAKKLVTTNLEFKILFVGDGELKEEIQAMTKEMDLESIICFLGNRADVYNVLQCIDIVLCPSFYEGLPVSLVEAQAIGAKCIVSSNVDCKVNITGDVQFIDINAESINNWVDAIKFFEKGDRKKNSEILKQKGYSIIDICKELEKIYLAQSVC